jgi:hypothetical protein
MKKVLTLMFMGMILINATFAFAEDVYATKNGKRYHKADCLLIKDKGAKAIALEEVEKKGLKACHRCFGTKPDAVNAQNPAVDMKTASLPGVATTK